MLGGGGRREWGGESLTATQSVASVCHTQCEYVQETFCVENALVSIAVPVKASEKPKVAVDVDA